MLVFLIEYLITLSRLTAAYYNIVMEETIMKKKDFIRISNIIQADKSVMSDACKALVLHDFANKFQEYFMQNLKKYN
mgnify:CR=1 FL=1